jgi:uncharacterized YigZ family protein
MSDHYRTIAEPAEARTRVERSEFLARAFPLQSEDAFFERLNVLQKTSFDATHHCWAFRLFANGRSRSSDAGEPSGTAGKPILGAIESSSLFDVAVVVSRWYGGVKLGTGGLGRAYRDAAALALRGAVIEDRYLYERFRVEASFDGIGQVYRLASAPDILVRGTTFGEPSVVELDVRRSHAERVARELTSRRLVVRRDD